MLISAIVDSISEQSKGRVAKVRDENQFVVVCGTVTDASDFLSIINSIFSTASKSKSPQRMVILSPVPATDEIRALISSTEYKQRVTYLCGSPVNENDLSRCKIDKALAVFLIPSKFYDADD